MKVKRLYLILLVCLAIGFASLSTIIIFNGTSSISVSNDFDVYFSKAKVDGIRKDNYISSDRKTINFSTSTLSKQGDTSKLEYTVTNNSTQYDANVVVSCTTDDEYANLVSITQTPMEDTIYAKSVGTGTVTVKLLQAKTEEITINFSCELNVTALETANINTIDTLIADSGNDGLDNQYIGRTEYNYQLTGDTKSSIEKQLGRNIDYGKDKFYPVDNEKAGITNGTYVYDTFTKKTYEITSKTDRLRSTWFWNDLATVYTDTEVNEDFFDTLEYYRINEVYYDAGYTNLNTDNVKEFIAECYAKDIKVYLTVGDTTWLGEDTYQSTIYDVFDAVLAYNEAVSYNQRFAGVNYDAEVWLNSDFDWQNNNESRKLHIDYIKTAQNYADAKGLSVSFTLPFWITQYSYTNDDGQSINMYDAITSVARETVLMVYRDTYDLIREFTLGVQDNATNSVEYYASKNDCLLNIAVESIDSAEGDYVTFYEEEKDSLGTILLTLSDVESTVENYTDVFVTSIHHATNLYNLYTNSEYKDGAVGSVYLIGNEKFYVLENSDTEMKLLAMYNLNVGDNAYSLNKTGIQSIYAKGWSSTSTRYGNVPFSSTSNEYEGSTVNSYVLDYVDYLKETYDVNVTGRLITLDELVSLGCDQSNNTCTTSDNKFLYNTSYWTMTSAGDKYDWYVNSAGYLAFYEEDGYTSNGAFGVRPIIILKK